MQPINVQNGNAGHLIMCHLTYMNDIETIGQRLKRLRKEAGLQQVDVVAALDIKIDRSHISKIESGKALPSWTLACALSDLYRVPLDYIRSGETMPQFQTPHLIKDEDEFRLLTAWRAMKEDEKTAFSLFAERIVKADDSFKKT